MPISSTDLNLRLSGGVSNTDPAASIGGAMSTEAGGVITTAELNNLFDNVTGDESAAGMVDYRCVYIENDHATITWEAVKLWIATVSASTDSVYAIALDGGGLNATAEVEADEDTPPTGETFSSPTTKAAGLSLGDMDAGDNYPIWIRRTISSGASANNSDGPTIRFEGDTGA